jgi:hypothetical protein
LNSTNRRSWLSRGTKKIMAISYRNKVRVRRGKLENRFKKERKLRCNSR